MTADVTVCLVAPPAVNEAGYTDIDGSNNADMRRQGVTRKAYGEISSLQEIKSFGSRICRTEAREFWWLVFSNRPISLVQRIDALQERE